MIRLGIDVGGSGVKGATVDVVEGRLTVDRLRIDTPVPATPDAVTAVIGEIGQAFPAEGTVGVTFPGVVRHGVIGSAANVDRSWIGVDAAARFAEVLGRPVAVLNDADAAAVAEAEHGAAVGRAGVVIVLTFGTGIGSGVLLDGRLVPNTELGHLEVGGVDAELRASASARKRDSLPWAVWAERVDAYLAVVEMLFSPDLIVIGGGVSKSADKFLPLLRRRTEIVPAALRNEAGIIGAADAAHRAEVEPHPALLRASLSPPDLAAAEGPPAG